MINLKKALRLILVCALAALFFVQPVLASQINVSSVNRINLSRGTISGARVAYSLNIRTSWQTFLIAERETFDNPVNGLLERITFFYVPQDRITRPVELMSFFVYESAFWSNRTRVRRILETENHVFAASAATLNPFSSGFDRTTFGTLLRDASSDTFVRNMIALPHGTRVLTNNVVWVSGRERPTPSVQLGNIVFIPVRDVAVALGYQVVWDARERTITFTRGHNFEYVMNVVPLVSRRSLDAVIINNRAYASSMFFTQIFKASVEIDENNNVHITG